MSSAWGRSQGGSGGHDGAVARALSWLAQHHRKAFAAALQEAVDEALFKIFENEDDAREAMAGIDDALRQQIQLNLTEWLLAEGDIQVKGEPQRVAELLLGARGPLLSTGQRAWLEQLARRPMRLYDVTEVVPGASITLCDALDTERPPQVVTERSGSRSLKVGMQLGARVMEVDGGNQLSGAIYPYSLWAGRSVQAQLREIAAQPSRHEEDNVLMIGLTIIEGWLAQYLKPAPLPDIVDSATGEPLLFTTDHYDVLDWDALAAALAAQPDVYGDRDTGWDRLLKGADGQTRSQPTIAPEPQNRRVAVQYKTAGLAERGHAWFDALDGQTPRAAIRSVAGLERVKGLLRSYEDGETQQAALQGRREISYQFLWDTLGLTR